MDSWNQGPFIPWNESQAYPRNQPSMDFYDRSPPKFRDRLSMYPRDPWPHERHDRRPTNYRNTWPPEHWDQRPSQIRRSSVSYEPWFEPAPYYDSLLAPAQILYPKSVQINYISEPYSHRDMNAVPYRRRDQISSYYQRNVPVASRSQCKAPAVSTHKHHSKSSARNVPVASRSKSKAPVDSAKKHHSKSSIGNCGTLATVSVNSDTTQTSSNDAASILVPGRKRAGRKRTGAKKAAKRAKKAAKRARKAAIKRALKESSSLLVNGMNGNGSLLVRVENNDTTVEDVQYLYSVDPNEGMLVELVDLSENSQISENEELLVSESNNSYIPVNLNSAACDLATFKDSTCDDPTNTLINDDKEKSDAENTPKEHGASGDAYCNVCNKSFKELLNNRCDLYSARCGHLFCVLCIKHLKIKIKCIQCKKVISSLKKISL